MESKAPKVIANYFILNKDDFEQETKFLQVSENKLSASFDFQLFNIR